MYLDTITPAQSSVGYGQLGVAWQLGYEGQQVRVQGRAYAHSLSTHPPAAAGSSPGRAATACSAARWRSTTTRPAR